MSANLRRVAEDQENAYIGEPIGLVATALISYMDEAGIAETREAMQVEAISALESENRKLSRWLKTSWERINCPECGSLCVFGKGFEEHADGCEFAAWLGSRDRKGDVGA